MDYADKRRVAAEQLEARIAEMTRAEDGWFDVEELVIRSCDQLNCGVAHFADHARVETRRVRIVKEGQ